MDTKLFNEIKEIIKEKKITQIGENRVFFYYKDGEPQSINLSEELYQYILTYSEFNSDIPGLLLSSENLDNCCYEIEFAGFVASPIEKVCFRIKNRKLNRFTTSECWLPMKVFEKEEFRKCFPESSIRVLADVSRHIWEVNKVRVNKNNELAEEFVNKLAMDNVEGYSDYSTIKSLIHTIKEDRDRLRFWETAKDIIYEKLSDEEKLLIELDED